MITTYPIADILELAQQRAAWRAPRSSHNRDFAYDADDIAQEAAAQVAAMRLPANAHRGYVRRIVDRRVLDFIRWMGKQGVKSSLNRRGNRMSRTGEIYEQASRSLNASPSSDPAYIVMTREQVELALGGLSDREREILEGEAGGLSQSMLGKEIGMSQTRVGQVSRQAKRYAVIALQTHNSRVSYRERLVLEHGNAWLPSGSDAGGVEVRQKQV